MATVKKSDLAGWKKVYAFTFVQHFKSKASIIALILLCLSIIASGPLLTIFGTSGIESAIENIGECKIEEAYIINNTDYEFYTDKFIEENPAYEKIQFINADDTLENLKEKFASDATKDIIMDIGYDEAKGRYYINIYRSQKSEIGSTFLQSMHEHIEDFFDDCRLEQSGISAESQEMIEAPVKVNIVESDDETDAKKDDDFNVVMSTIIIIYSFVIMMMVLVSSQQISVSIVVEKSSKIVETLMVSVKPLALIVGKILGTITILLCNLVAVIISAIISGIISMIISAKTLSQSIEALTSGMSDIGSGYSPGSLDSSVVTNSIDISLGRIIFGIFIIIITTLLAYLMYAVISGISGAACSSMEDVSGASTFISVMTIIGLYTSMGITAIDNDIVTTIAYFFPFSGIYLVPVHYIFAKTSIISVLILWAELIVFTILLSKFAARIYHVLLLHKGERLKLKNLISISKAEKGESNK